MRFTLLLIFLLIISGCDKASVTRSDVPNVTPSVEVIALTLDEANRLASLPLKCIQQPLPYKPGLVVAHEDDLAMPQTHHPAFYGCYDWHSAVHGHWSLVYLLKNFPELEERDSALRKLKENLTAAHIEKEVAYFTLNNDSKTFERTYGWVWLLKLAEELYTWDDPVGQELYSNLTPLCDYIVNGYMDYLPKLVYPIRVGEHSNTAFGLSFAYDYAKTLAHEELQASIIEHAKRFYLADKACPITWEPSGYDFLSPCLEELNIMAKILDDASFANWSRAFLPSLFSGELDLEPGRIIDRSDGKLVHLDGLNFSRAWCLYSLSDCVHCKNQADEHLQFSLSKITDGDYAGQHWLASFALYAFSKQAE